ncbi:hypothetical protein [Kiloniella sp. b19]|uniref:hypothetical protein n=1 Tax=Kiloniella sp. GXU_MW_B19 TaxID=3141326 RepID=UPI0031D43618
MERLIERYTSWFDYSLLTVEILILGNALDSFNTLLTGIMATEKSNHLDLSSQARANAKSTVPQIIHKKNSSLKHFEKAALPDLYRSGLDINQRHLARFSQCYAESKESIRERPSAH